MNKVTAYIKESYNELVQKVSWPSWEELQSSAIVVMIASSNHGSCHFRDGFCFPGVHEFVL